MKTTKALFGILTLTTALAVQVHAQTFLTNGLVAYYPFDGNANDASGNGVSTSLTGNRSFSTIQGRPCLLLNTGFTPPTLPQPVGMVSVTRPAALNPTSDITISTWLNINRLTSGAFPSSGNDDWTNGPHAHSIVSFGDMGFGAYNILVKTFTNQTPDVVQVIGGNYAFTVQPNLPPQVGQWAQLVVTKTAGRNVTVYWNGVVLGTGTLAGPGNPSQHMLIGKNDIGTPFDYPLIGSLAAYRVYNRVLSTAEVQQLYAWESQPCTPHRATATAVVNNGFVVAATVTDGGCGYTNTPLVLIQGGGGTGVTATAVVSNGVVVGITITDAGFGYTNTPTVSVASPPFVPWLAIGVSKVSVTQHVVLGKNYVLESSTDLQNWNQVGLQFTAQNEVITQEFDVDLTGRYFRIRQVP